VIVSVEEPVGVTEVGENEYVTPEGSELVTERETE
jgi:hypothetical protein